MHAVSLLRRPFATFALVAFALTATAARAVAQLAAVPEQTADQAWADLKGDNYEQRDHFMAGANRLSARLDEQIRALQAKRAGMTTDLADWDIAMKDVDESRALLTGKITEVKKATTPEAWASARDGVGDAWSKAEAAVDKMHTTVTS